MKGLNTVNVICTDDEGHVDYLKAYMEDSIGNTQAEHTFRLKVNSFLGLTVDPEEMDELIEDGVAVRNGRTVQLVHSTD